jgi:hypothetical protein
MMSANTLHVVILATALTVVSLTLLIVNAVDHDHVYAYIRLTLANTEHHASAYNASYITNIGITMPIAIYLVIYASLKNKKHWLCSFRMFSFAISLSDFAMVWSIASNVGIWDVWAVVFISTTAMAAVIVVDKPNEIHRSNWLVATLLTVMVFTALMFSLWKQDSPMPNPGDALFTCFLVWYHIRLLLTAFINLCTQNNPAVKRGQVYSMVETSEEVTKAFGDATDKRRTVFCVDGWVKLAFPIVAFFVAFYKRSELP